MCGGVFLAEYPGEKLIFEIPNLGTKCCPLLDMKVRLVNYGKTKHTLECLLLKHIDELWVGGNVLRRCNKKHYRIHVLRETSSIR